MYCYILCFSFQSSSVYKEQRKLLCIQANFFPFVVAVPSNSPTTASQLELGPSIELICSYATTYYYATQIYYILYMLCGAMWYIIGHWECWLVTLLTGRIYMVYDQYIYYVGSQNVSNKSCYSSLSQKEKQFSIQMIFENEKLA